MRKLLSILFFLLVVLPMNGKGKEHTKERITERGSSLFYRSWRYPVVAEEKRDSVQSATPPANSLPVVDSLSQDSILKAPLPQDSLLRDSLPQDSLSGDSMPPIADNGTQKSDSPIHDLTNGDGGQIHTDENDGKDDGKNDGKDDRTKKPSVERPDINTCIVYFIFDQSNFIQDYKAEFDTIMAFIDYHKGKDFEVIGHTDERGTVAYNQGLSERRAKRVYDVLVKRGVPANRMTIIGKSELEPAIPHASNEKEHQLNRRVEIVVSSE